MKKILGTTILITAAVLMANFATLQFSGAEETAKDSRFIAYDNGTVLDTKTNLIWAAADNGATLNWLAAKTYCEGYRGGGYKDWRLPTQDELAGLYDVAAVSKISDGRTAHLTKLIRLTTAILWASESSVLSGSITASRSDTSSIFIFTKGKRLFGRSENSSDICVLPVRVSK